MWTLIKGIWLMLARRSCKRDFLLNRFQQHSKNSGPLHYWKYSALNSQTTRDAGPQALHQTLELIRCPLLQFGFPIISSTRSPRSTQPLQNLLQASSLFAPRDSGPPTFPTELRSLVINIPTYVGTYHIIVTYFSMIGTRTIYHNNTQITSLHHNS